MFPLIADQVTFPVCMLLPYWSTPLTSNWKLWPNSNWGIEDIIISSVSLGGAIIVIGITSQIELTEALTSKSPCLLPAIKLPFWSILPHSLLTNQVIAPVCMLSPYWSTPLTRNSKVCPNSNRYIEDVIISSVSFGGSIISSSSELITQYFDWNSCLARSLYVINFVWLLSNGELGIGNW